MQGLTRLDDSLSIRQGHLFIEECEVAELARAFGTPLYVVSEDQLQRNLERFQSAFSAAWPHGPVRLLPAIKANPLLAIARIFAVNKIGLDCFGHNEMIFALKAGVPAPLISLNGPRKSSETMRLAVEAGVRITLNSTAEVALAREAANQVGKRAKIRFRLRPDYSGIGGITELHPPVPAAVAARRYRMGMATADVLRLGAEVLKASELEMIGVHIHFGRHRAEAEVWRGLMAAYASLLGRLRESWDGWEPEEIDIGGGFAARRDPPAMGYAHATGTAYREAPPVEEYARVAGATLAEELTANGLTVSGKVLEVEPGRALFGDAGIHLASVVNLKSDAVEPSFSWVETDTSEVIFGDHSEDRFPVYVADRAGEEPTEKVDITGASCNADSLLPDAKLPRVKVGDVLAFLDAGAYQEPSAGNFNLLVRPATVLVKGDQAELIKRAEILEDLLSRDVIPERLAMEQIALSGAET